LGDLFIAWRRRAQGLEGWWQIEQIAGRWWGIGVVVAEDQLDAEAVGVANQVRLRGERVDVCVYGEDA